MSKPILKVRTKTDPPAEGELVIEIESIGEMYLARLEAEPGLAAVFGLNQESHTGIAWTGPDEATVIRRATAWVKRKAEILE